MTTRFVESEHDRDMAVKEIADMRLPFTLSMEEGKRRTVLQNRLAFQWYTDAGKQKEDETTETIRGYCKLTIGVPILRAENEAFRVAYDTHIRPLPYETKLAMMMAPLDWPVTSLMTTKQLTRYLDEMQRHYAEQGIILTTPEWADFMNGPK